LSSWKEFNQEGENQTTMARKPPPNYAEEIEIEEGFTPSMGYYIEPLLRQWQLIAACALGLGVLALAFLLVLRFSRHIPAYRATVLVASTTSSSSVNFNTAMNSAVDYQVSQSAGNVLYVGSPTRLQSFVSQVQNGAVAEQVLEIIGPMLKNKTEESLTAQDLLDMVSGELISGTDTIEISVIYSDPVLAAEIANAWGKAYVRRINDIYSSSGTTSLATEAEVAQANAVYDKAEAVLEAFVSSDKTAEYKRKIDEISAINTLLSGTRAAVGEQQVQGQMDQLKQAYIDSLQIGRFRDNAVSMRAAIDAGGEPAAISNALALTIFKTQIFAAFEGSQNLQVQNLPEVLGGSIATVNAAGMVADLDALITALDARQAELNKTIAGLSSGLSTNNYYMNFSNDETPIEPQISANEQKVRDLNSMITAQTSTLGELTLARDLAWKSYSALATKSIEMGVNAQNTQVVLASTATSPASPNPPTSLINIPLLATVMGLLFGIFIAYAYESWQNYKGRQPVSIFSKLLPFTKKPV
jgi:capsular polysaccharide biosynthesis protein